VFDHFIGFDIPHYQIIYDMSFKIYHSIFEKQNQWKSLKQYDFKMKNQFAQYYLTRNIDTRRRRIHKIRKFDQLKLG
jgi:hypothetical protein